MEIRFQGALKSYSTKTTVDLSKTTRLTIDTEQLLSKALDEIKPDEMITVTISTN